MSARRNQLHTAIAVVTSTLLHACVIGVAGMTSSAVLAPDQPELVALPAALPLPPIIVPPPAPSDSVPVGNPDSTITAETWLGYNEFEEHVATTRGPIDQPALSFDPPTSQPDAPPAPISSPPAPPPAVAQPAITAEPEPASTVAPEAPVEPITTPPDEPSPTEPQTTPSAEHTTLDQPKAPEPSPPTEDEPTSNPPPGDEPAPLTDTTPPPPSEPAELDGPPTDPVEPPAQPETPPPELQPQPPPTQPSAAVAPSPPAPPPSPSATDDARGVQSDRESDAAAIKTAARAHLGKPLATKGLRIRTVRPRTSHYNAILARYIDPVVRVHFDKRGVVAKVEFIRRSENRDVDLYVLNAVYQWTAEGPQLEALPNSDPPATISVDFVIVRPLSG